jgi:hypothetical protein
VIQDVVRVLSVVMVMAAYFFLHEKNLLAGGYGG